MDRARQVRMSRVHWVWSDVEAMSEGRVTELRHLSGTARLSVRDGRLHRGSGYTEATRDVRQQLARVGAIVRLRERGRYYLHASGAVDPSGRAWILTGDTGSGKSTLAFALSQSGWTVLGDDGVIVQVGDRVVAHAWREPLRVSLGLMPRYPSLAQVREQPLPSDERRRVPVTAAAASNAPVTGVLLLQQSSVHRLERASPGDALSAIVRQSPWVMLGDAVAPSHYRALHRIAHTVPVYHLAHSVHELDTLATTLSQAA